MRTTHDYDQLCTQCEKPLGDCECPYVFSERPAKKSSTSVVIANQVCPQCGCLLNKSRRQGCQCICHGE